MGKSPSDFSNYIAILEDNFLDTVDSLKDVTDEQWKTDLKFPIGLVNKIKKELANSNVEMLPPQTNINTKPIPTVQ